MLISNTVVTRSRRSCLAIFLYLAFTWGASYSLTAAEYSASQRNPEAWRNLQLAVKVPTWYEKIGIQGLGLVCRAASWSTPGFMKYYIDNFGATVIRNIVKSEYIRNILKHLAFSDDNTKFAQYDEIVGVHRALSEQPVPLNSLLEQANEERKHWEKGLMSGAIYDGSPEHLRRLAGFFADALERDYLNQPIFNQVNNTKALALQAFEYFNTANPLHGTTFPLAVKAMRELGPMMANIFGAQHAIVSSGAREALRIGMRRIKLSIIKDHPVSVLAYNDKNNIIKNTARSLNINYLEPDSINAGQDPDFIVFYATPNNLRELRAAMMQAYEEDLKIHLHVSQKLFRDLIRGSPALADIFTWGLELSLSFDSEGLIYNALSATIFSDSWGQFSSLEAHIGWEKGGLYPGINSAGSIAGVDYIIAYTLLLNMGNTSLKNLAQKTCKSSGCRQECSVLDDDLNKHAELVKIFNSQRAVEFKPKNQQNANRDELERILLALNLSIYNASAAEFTGRMTSGGTESIRLAMKLHIENFRARNNHKPIILMTKMAHVAFERQIADMDAEIMGIETKNEVMDLADLERVIRIHGADNIAAIVVSVPAYPFGLPDNLRGAALSAKSHNIPLHVDGCLGGFVHQFIENNPLKIDFSDTTYDGVSSWSWDLHKYGVSGKGLSAIGVRRALVKDPASLETICEPRSASCLHVGIACMLYEGRAGYEQRASELAVLGRRFAEEIMRINELELVGRPLDENIPDWVIAFRLKGNLRELTYSLAHLMSKLGWHIKQVGDYTLHFALTSAHAHQENFLEIFMSDLAQAVGHLKPDMKISRSVGLYGMAANLPQLSMGQKATAAWLTIILRLYAENIIKLPAGK